MNGFLNVRVDVLNTDGCTIDSKLAEGLNLILGQCTRISFDAYFSFIVDIESCADSFAEAIDLLGVEKIWSPASEVDLHDIAFVSQVRTNKSDLFLEVADISIRERLIGVNDLRAAAEPAETLAERQMKVQ